MDELIAKRSNVCVEKVLAMSGISREEFLHFYNGEYVDIGFYKAAEILTNVMNPSCVNYFQRWRWSSEKRQALLLAAYCEDGGDPQYFISGSGAPGNCVIS